MIREQHFAGADSLPGDTNDHRLRLHSPFHLRRFLATLAGGSLVLGTPVLSAQEAAVDVEQFHGLEDLSGGIMTSGSSTLEKGSFALNLWGSYADDPLVFVREGEELYKLQAAASNLELGVAFGIFDGLQIGAAIPFTPYQSVNFDNPYALDGASAQTLHDIALRARVRILNLAEKGFGLALEPRVWLPTGSIRSYSGGQLGAGLSLIADKQLGQSWLGANLGYRWRPEQVVLANTPIDDELLYRLGVGVPVGRTWLSADLFGTIALHGVPQAQLASSPAEILLGASRYLGHKLTGTLGASTGLVAGYGSPDFRIVAGLSFGAPRGADKDGDKILDFNDQCIDDPEDYDGFQDLDGCPDPDNDQDGILDVNDRCPNDPEDKDGFQDADGCPDPDNDQDGILDADDKCPNDPEDKDGFQDADGCPDPDNDQDGILDVSDRCPNDPEDKDGFQDEDGCPDPDNDQDGILDINDRCPLVAENMNGFEDEDGCPDVKEESADIEVRDGKLILLERIHFEFDKDVILPRSFPILNEAASVLKNNPELRVRIEGHTDWKGTDEYNLELSRRRAESVKRYMVEKAGLPAERFETEGYGESRPIETNETEEGRAMNRRIDWVFID